MVPGSKWFKFDFHVHTPASDDYQEADVSSRDWLLACMEKELDAVVICDHNTGSGIDDIQAELQKMRAEADEIPGFRELTIFPGVELTASEGVHILALFSDTAKGVDIERLIGNCAGTASARLSQEKNNVIVLGNSISEIVRAIHGTGCSIPIMAHVDGTKGCFHDIKNEGALKTIIDAKPLAFEVKGDASKLLSGATKAYSEGVALVRGSDAHERQYIGSRHCWLKMSDLNFDGLKTALFDHKNCVLTDGEPPSEPAMQIKQLALKTALCRHQDGTAVDVKFNPHYNTVIGSRGSGKSTLVESIRVAMRMDGSLPTEFKDKNSQFKTVGKVMADDSELVCIYTKNGSEYQLKWRPNGSHQLMVNDGGEWRDDQYWSADRFPVSIYSQKMLYKLATDNNAFLKIIDASPEVGFLEWKQTMDQLVLDYKQKCIELRGREADKKKVSELSGKLSDVKRSLQQLEESQFTSRQLLLAATVREKKKFDDAIQAERDLLSELKSQLLLTDSKEPAGEKPIDECWKLLNKAQNTVRDHVLTAITTAEFELSKLEEAPCYVALKATISDQRSDVAESHAMLEGKNVNPETAAQLFTDSESLQSQLEQYSDLDSKTLTAATERDDLHRAMVEHRKQLTVARQAFIKTLKLDGLSVKVLPMGANAEQVVNSYQVATNIAKFDDHIYDPDVSDSLLKKFLDQKVHDPRPQVVDEKYQKLHTVKNLHSSICSGDVSVGSQLHGRFKSKISQMSGESLDALMCWFPDDGVDIRYKIDGVQNQSLADASPGQKSASMLQFILSYGDDPIILDQPEDDLDCKMLSQSVIPAINANKQRRQLIIVTHSAPIVVNGDAEYVVSMIRDKNGIRTGVCGGLQESTVKTFICDQMEGGKVAFDARYKRLTS